MESEVAQHDLAAEQDLGVVARDARVVDADVDVGAAAEPGDGAGERVRDVVGDEARVAGARPGGGGRRRGCPAGALATSALASLCTRNRPVSRSSSRVELDLGAAEERVALLLGVLADHRRRAPR